MMFLIWEESIRAIYWINSRPSIAAEEWIRSLFISRSFFREGVKNSVSIGI
jgi:hypothetical protein